MSLIAYGGQLLVAGPIMTRYGLVGYLALWCINEILQLFYLIRLNERLFGDIAKVDRRPVYILFGFLAIGTALLIWPMYNEVRFPLWQQGLIALATTVVTLALSYRLFRVDEVRSFLWRKFAARFPHAGGAFRLSLNAARGPRRSLPPSARRNAPT